MFGNAGGALPVAAPADHDPPGAEIAKKIEQENGVPVPGAGHHVAGIRVLEIFFIDRLVENFDANGAEPQAGERDRRKGKELKFQLIEPLRFSIGHETIPT